MAPKKLIETGIPLKAINEACEREKHLYHGHPAALHTWWARRPLAAARAVLFASLIDDPAEEGAPKALVEEIDQLPLNNQPKPETPEGEIRRQKLYAFIKELVTWENFHTIELLETARRLIRAACGGEPPAFLDPFAGGGAIPLEAQRLGLAAYAGDLNPVAVIINKAMVEYPRQFAEHPPVNPDAKSRVGHENEWRNAAGLRADIGFYGKWMREEAEKTIGSMYPKIKDQDGTELDVSAWVWTRTVACPSPGCGIQTPLRASFELSKKKGVYVQPVVEGNTIRYEVRHGGTAPPALKTGRGQFRCAVCGYPIRLDYIRDQGKAGRISKEMMAIMAKGKEGKRYVAPNDAHRAAARVEKPSDVPTIALADGSANGIRVTIYGLDTLDKLFTNRQLTTLAALSRLVTKARDLVKEHGGSEAYAQAVGVYLACGVDKMANNNSVLCVWNTATGTSENTFSRPAMPMKWDFAEANPFGDSRGNFERKIDEIQTALGTIGPTITGTKAGGVFHGPAQDGVAMRGLMVSTDPPYYDNIIYGDLGDFFYGWMRQNLGDSFPDLFRRSAVPKDAELVMAPHRHGGKKEKAGEFFENEMARALSNIHRYTCDTVPTTIYYAYKQKEKGGWTAMLNAIITAGFRITATWPLRTERKGLLREHNSSALASSIVLVCRKRPPENAPVCSRGEFTAALRRELPEALRTLDAAGISPVDMPQAALGCGMAIYTRYAKVLKADGEALEIEAALVLITEAVDTCRNEIPPDLDPISAFCVKRYQYDGFNEQAAGEADGLMRAEGVSETDLVKAEVLKKSKNKVRLARPEELATGSLSIIWALAQILAREFENGGIAGAAAIAAKVDDATAERAKALASYLFGIAERKGFSTEEAVRYKNLVGEWPRIREKAAGLRENPEL